MPLYRVKVHFGRGGERFAPGQLVTLFDGPAGEYASLIARGWLVADDESTEFADDDTGEFDVDVWAAGDPDGDMAE